MTKNQIDKLLKRLNSDTSLKLIINENIRNDTKITTNENDTNNNRNNIFNYIFFKIYGI